jgi:hypothetical protein
MLEPIPDFRHFSFRQPARHSMRGHFQFRHDDRARPPTASDASNRLVFRENPAKPTRGGSREKFLKTGAPLSVVGCL